MACDKKKQLEKLLKATRQMEQRDFGSVKNAALRQIQESAAEKKKRKDYSKQVAVLAMLLLIVSGFGIARYLQRGVPTEVQPDDPPTASVGETERTEYGMVYQSLKDAFERRKQTAGESPMGGNEFGETNVLIEGAEEAGSLKSDEKRLFALSTYYEEDQTRRVLSVIDMETLAVLDRVPISAESFDSVSGILVYGKKLAVIGNKWNEPGDSAVTGFSMPYPSAVVLQIYDIAANGKLIYQSEWVQEGSYSTAILDEQGYLYLTTRMLYFGDDTLPLTEATVESYVPHIYNSAVDGETRALSQDKIHISKMPGSSNYYVLSAIPLENPAAGVTIASLGALRSVLYISGQNLYIVSSEKGDGGVSTHIERYALSGGSVTLNQEGGTQGAFINQFTVCEWGGTLRILTSQTEGESTKMMLSVLDDSLLVIGQTEGFTVEEPIVTAQLAGQAGYIMTQGEWAEAGPTYGIDLRDPAAPKMTGVSESSGVSSYFRQLDETALLGVSRRVEERTGDIRMRLSVLDVSDPANPAEINGLTLSGNCWGVGFRDRSAVLYLEEQALLVLPVESSEMVQLGNAVIRNGDTNGLMVFEVSKEKGITYRGGLSGSTVRSFIMTDDVFYTISDDLLIKADRITLEQTVQLSLHGGSAEEGAASDLVE